MTATQRTVRSVVAAGLTTGLAVAATLLAPAAPAGAAATHIGIVVRFADGSSKTACTTSGGSGLAVLERKFTVVIGKAPPYAGFVFKINNQGSTHPDSSHYWGYWHSSGNGTWTYSSSGAGSYTPKAGTVEGWSYVNGSSTATKPPAIKYATLCASSDPKPKVVATATPARVSTERQQPVPVAPADRAASSTRPTATGHGATRGTTTGVEPGTTAGVAASATASKPSGARVGSATASAASGIAAASGTAAASAVGPSSTATSGAGGTPLSASSVAGSIRAADPPARTSNAALPAVGTALALLVVAAIGVTAWLRSRQRRA